MESVEDHYLLKKIYAKHKEMANAVDSFYNNIEKLLIEDREKISKINQPWHIDEKCILVEVGKRDSSHVNRFVVVDKTALTATIHFTMLSTSEYLLQFLKNESNSESNDDKQNVLLAEANKDRIFIVRYYPSLN
jgi:hypothetical protein